MLPAAGVIQTTDRDEFSYQEMITNLPLCALKVTHRFHCAVLGEMCIATWLSHEQIFLVQDPLPKRCWWWAVVTEACFGKLRVTAA